MGLNIYIYIYIHWVKCQVGRHDPYTYVAIDNWLLVGILCNLGVVIAKVRPAFFFYVEGGWRQTKGFIQWGGFGAYIQYITDLHLCLLLTNSSRVMVMMVHVCHMPYYCRALHALVHLLHSYLTHPSQPSSALSTLPKGLTILERRASEQRRSRQSSRNAGRVFWPLD